MGIMLLQSRTETLVSRIDPRQSPRYPLLRVIFYLTSAVLALNLILTYHSLLTIRVPRDAGAFLTIADKTLEGYLPYRDFVDHKPPGIYYTLAVALAVDRSVEAARWLLLSVNLGTGVVLIAVGRRLWSYDVGILAAILYLGALPWYQGVFLLTEPFVALALVAGLHFLLGSTEHRGGVRPLAVGLCLGIALLFKQTSAAAIPVFVGAVLLLPVARDDGFVQSIRQLRRRQAAVSVAAFTVGLVAPVAIVTAYFSSLGALGELFYWTTIVNGDYGASINARTIGLLQDRLGLAAGLWIASVFGGVLLFRHSTPRNTSWAVVLTALAATAALPLLLRQFHHYFIMILPFAVLLIAGGTAVAGSWVAARTTMWTAPRCGVAMAVLMVTAPMIVPAATGSVSVPGGDGTLAEQRALADQIAAETSPSEGILVLAAEPQFYFLADRDPIDQNVYYLPINRNVSYTDAGLTRRVETVRPAVVLIRDCRDLERTCATVRDTYELRTEYPRGISLWRLPANHSHD